MAIFSGLSEKLWSYVSPQKTRERRDRQFKVPSLPARALKEKGKEKDKDKAKGKGNVAPSPRSPSPNARVMDWKLRSPGSESSEYRPLSPPESLERTYTDFEGDTIIDELHEKIDGGPGGGYDANDDTIVVDDGHYYEDMKYIDTEGERMRQETKGMELRAAGWAEDAVFLFQKLSMRGFEPLMPKDWQFHFVMMPDILFTRKRDKAFIKTTFGTDFQAVKALQELLQSGTRARDAILTKAPVRTPEFHIKQATTKYHKWATKDGKVNNDLNLPLFEIVTGSKDKSVAELQQEMVTKLEKLAKRWQKALDLGIGAGEGGSSISDVPQLPTLYGLLASHTIMGFVSFDPVAGDSTLRTVGFFDWGQDGFDVWNSLAIAILIVHCRNRMQELEEYIPQGESGSASDPDA